MKSKGLNPRRLALAIGTNPSLIQDIVSGKVKEPRVNTLEAVANALDVSAKDLVTETLQIPASNPTTDEQADHILDTHTHKVPVLSWEDAGSWLMARRTFNPAECKDFHSTVMEVSDRAVAMDIEDDSICAPGRGSILCEGVRIIVDSRETQAEYKSGDFVLALPANSRRPTLKKLIIDGDKRYLKPLNPDYDRLEMTPNCQIIGVAVSAEQVL